jgi:hypothetical protein
MSDPFSPPKSPVEMPVVIVPRPAKISLAVNLLWITVALSVVTLIPGIRDGLWDDQSGFSFVIMLVIMAIIFGLYGVLIYFIGQGHNWARWLSFVLFLVGLISIYGDPDELITQGGLAVGMELLISALEICAFVLLFQKSSSRWFKGETETEPT